MPSEQDGPENTTVEQYDLSEQSPDTTSFPFGDDGLQSVHEVEVELVPPNGDPIAVPNEALVITDSGDLTVGARQVLEDAGVHGPVQIHVEAGDPIDIAQRRYVEGDLTEEELEDCLETAIERQEAGDAE